MSRQINQPINQVKLTNVAVVRCNKNGKRFEIACYRNKVMDYRAGLETDLSEVLQTDRIFTNVSKGQFAKVSDLESSFGTRDQKEIARIILEQSDQKNWQVSDLERAQSMQDTLSQIANWVAANCVHADGSNRPFTPSQIRLYLGKNYTVYPINNKPIKKQCLDAVKFLRTVCPIERAKMELQLQYPQEKTDIVQSALDTQEHRFIKLLPNTPNHLISIIIQVDPSLYRTFSDLMTQVGGSLEILEQVVMAQQQGDMELEMQFKTKQQQQAQPQPTIQHTLEEQEDEQEEQQDSDVEELVEKLQRIRANHDNAYDEHEHKTTTKQKNHKSKKAKRREMEEQQEQMRSARERESRRPEPQPTREVDGVDSTTDAASAAATKCCNTCGGSFANANAYRAHFRSDWHRFNQKLLLQGIPPVTEEEFRLCDEETFFRKN